MEFHKALILQEDTEAQRSKLDESYDAKLAALRKMYEERKEQLENDHVSASGLINQAAKGLKLDDPRVVLGSRAIRIVGDWHLAGRDGSHCCREAALNIARTNGDCLGHYSYCTVTQGVIHGLHQVLPLGEAPAGNDIPLFRIEGTPEVIHRLRTGSRLPDSVVEAAVYFVHHLPQLFALGWKWETALMDDRDLFAGDPKIAAALSSSDLI